MVTAARWRRRLNCLATDAATELGWTAQRDLHTMMRDAWRWQAQNPEGYHE